MYILNRPKESIIGSQITFISCGCKDNIQPCFFRKVRKIGEDSGPLTSPKRSEISSSVSNCSTVEAFNKVLKQCKYYGGDIYFPSSRRVYPKPHVLIEGLNAAKIKLSNGKRIIFSQAVYRNGNPLLSKFYQDEVQEFIEIIDSSQRDQASSVPKFTQSIMSLHNTSSKNAIKSQNIWDKKNSLFNCQSQGRLMLRYCIQGQSNKKYCILTYKQLNGLSDKFDPEIKIIIQHKKMRKQQKLIKNLYKQNHYLRNLHYPKIKYEKKLQFPNLSVGFLTQKQFYPYFDTQPITKNFGETGCVRNYIWVKKPEGEGTYNSIHIYTALLNGKIIKTEFSLETVKNLTIDQRESGGKFYFTLSQPPKYYIHSIENSYGFEIYSISKWIRTENFPLLQNQTIKILNDQLILLQLRANITLEVDLTSGQVDVRNSFDALKKLFAEFKNVLNQESRQILITKVPHLEELSYYFNKQQFQSYLKKVPKADRPLAFQVEFCLCNLLQTCTIEYSDAIQFLQWLIKSLEFLQIYRDVLVRLSPIIVQKKEQSFLDFFKDQVKNYMRKKEKRQEKIKKQLEQSMLRRKQDTPQEFGLNSHVKIPNVRVTPSGVKFSEFSDEVRNRVLKQFSRFEHQFLKVQIMDENKLKIPASDHLTGKFIRKQLDKIEILGRTYVPLAWSQSQLKNSSLWYICQDLEESINRQKVLEFLGDFSSILNHALKAARMGQNMASAWSFDAKKIKCKVSRDVFPAGSKLKYTDGIGGISENLIYEIAKQMGVKDLCAIQVRYKGAKGLVAINPMLENNQIELRDSMVKYQCENEAASKYLDILGWNKYKVGFLNREIIILLSSRAIPTKVFLDLQKQSIFQLIKSDAESNQLDEYLKRTSLNHFFEEDQNFKEISHAIRRYTDVDPHYEPYIQGIIIAIKEKSLQNLRLKANIKVQKSARLLGITDQFKVLRQNQIYCSIKKSPQSKVENISGKVCLTRNPCLKISDIQVVTCVTDKELDQRFEVKNLPNYFKTYFVNVVVFPQAGEKPLTSLICGSDLDGDEFFISWQDRIIPSQLKYNRAQEEHNPVMTVLEKSPGYPEMLNFFIEYMNNDNLGKLSNSFIVHADRNQSAECKECLALADIHGIAVDYPKKGYSFPTPKPYFVKHYPHWMQKTYPTVTYKSQSVFGQLYNNCKLQSEIEGLPQEIFQVNIQSFLFKVDYQRYRFEKNEIVRASKSIGQYQKQLQGILSYYNLTNQFQVYIGRHVKEGNQQSVKAVTDLRSRCRDKFFRQFSEKQQENCFRFRLSELECESVNRLPRISLEIQRKVVLWYLLSHSHLVSKSIFPQQFRGIFKKDKENGQFGNKCFGVTWFCFPKLVLWMFKKIQLDSRN